MRLFAAVCLAAWLPLPVSAADSLADAAAAIKGHRFQTALRLLDTATPKEAVATPSGQFSLGLSLYHNAELYREYAAAAREAQQVYLMGLVNKDKERPSKYAALFLGEALLAGGDCKAAIPHLTRYTQSGADTNLRSVAQIDIGKCYFRHGETQRAREAWRKVTNPQPEVRIALAAAYAGTGETEHALVLLEQGLGQLRGSDARAPRVIADTLTTYIAAQRYDTARALLREADLGRPAVQESYKDGTVIGFYDLSVLASGAELYSRAARDAFARAAKEPKFAAAAGYYLTILSAVDGNSAQGIDASVWPAPLRARLAVWTGAAAFTRGQRDEATTLWRKTLRDRPDDTELLADLLRACVQVNAECREAQNAAQQQLVSGRSVGVRELNTALGRLLLKQGKVEQALPLLEAARDKSNKNKIQYNAPLLLVSLAEAYYKNKVYSEHLEIYFELGNEFPVVRPIQEAVQGIYATAQNSAGDVRIF